MSIEPARIVTIEEEGSPFLFIAVDSRGEPWEVRPIASALDPLSALLRIVEVHRPGGQWTLGVGHYLREAAEAAVNLAYVTDEAEDLRA